LAFVNAGMNQFKNVFLDKHTPDYCRATNSQKCIRVGGKHNDLKDVGFDSYHHTFFEMLGNWSFGDYFKIEACQMAWTLLTEIYKIDKRRLYVTYFGGNTALQLPPDLECREIWKKLGLAEDRILPFGMKDNFWEMGPTGPCGSCTEIHVDHLPYSQGVNRGGFVNAGHADLTELWNIVFIEFDRNKDGSIQHLPNKHIDTGMGLERLVTILQNKTSNYDTDLFTPIFDRTAKVCKMNRYGGSFSQSDSSFQLDTDYRILADHSRMITACLSDGMFPDHNHKLRRILRRAILIGEKSFGNPKLLHDTIPVVVEILGEAYPEMARNLEKSQHIISHETDLFQFLRKGVSSELRAIIAANPNLDEQDIVQYPGFVAAFKELEKLKSEQKLVEGDAMDCFLFKLQDTYGLDDDGVAKILEIGQIEAEDLETRLRGVKESFKFQTNTSSASVDGDSLACISKSSLQTLPKTNDQYKYDYKYNDKKKLYQTGEMESEIKMIIVGNEVRHCFDGVSGSQCHIVTEKSNFYSESGGQESDEGVLVFLNNPLQSFRVQAVQELDGAIIHSGEFHKIVQFHKCSKF
jgi:alanyl-tRNA synthetase